MVMKYTIDRRIICGSLFLLFLVFWFLFWFGARGNMGKEWFTPSGYYTITWEAPSKLGGWKATQLGYNVYISSSTNNSECSVKSLPTTPTAIIASGQPLSYNFSDGDFGTDYYVSVLAVAPDGTTSTAPACTSFTPRSPQQINFVNIIGFNGKPIDIGYDLTKGFAIQTTTNFTESELTTMLTNSDYGIFAIKLTPSGLNPIDLVLYGTTDAICQYGDGTNNGQSTKLQSFTSGTNGAPNTAVFTLVSFANCKFPSHFTNYIINTNYEIDIILKYSGGGPLEASKKFTGTSTIGAVQNLQISQFIQS